MYQQLRQDLAWPRRDSCHVAVLYIEQVIFGVVWKRTGRTCPSRGSLISVPNVSSTVALSPE